MINNINLKSNQMKKLYNLVYVVNGKVIETILTQQSSSLCNWKKQQLKNSGAYSIGLLQARSVNSIKYDLPKTIKNGNSTK